MAFDKEGTLRYLDEQGIQYEKMEHKAVFTIEEMDEVGISEDLEAEVLGSGQQIVLQTLSSAGGDGAGVDAAAQQNDEQSRHDDLGDLLNVLGDAEQQHEHNAEQQDEGPDASIFS